MEPSIAQRVREHVMTHPHVRGALALGIVNHSALARSIMEAEGLSSHTAVLKSLTRLQDDLETTDNVDAKQALAEARLEVRTGVAMLTYTSSWKVLDALTRRAQAIVDESERIHILHGTDALTTVANNTVIDDLRKALPDEHELDYRDRLAEINVRTSDALDGVPGFLAFIAAGLADRGICVVDATTCRRDHIFVIDEDSVTSAVEGLQALVG